jgi:chitinase
LTQKNESAIVGSVLSTNIDNNMLKQILVFGLVFLIAACSKTSEETELASISIDAGIDLVVNEQTEVKLQVSASNSDNLNMTYLWQQVSGEPIALENSTTWEASFTSPPMNTNDEPIVYEFEVTVSTSSNNSVTDRVKVTINAIDNLPVVELGDNRTANEGDEITLTGIASDEAGEIISTTWSQTAGPEIALDVIDQLDLNVTIPDLQAVNGEQTFTFELTVTDDDNNQISDTIDVVVTPVNIEPVAFAGEDQVVFEKQIVTLSGTATDEDGEVVGVQWTQTGGPLVTLLDGNKLETTFKAPDLDSELELVFILTVEDSDGITSSDEVKVLIQVQQARLNDTGVTTCGDYQLSGGGSNSLTCGTLANPSSSVVIGQDGFYGHDVTDSSSSDGNKGFSFTKIDALGNEVAQSASSWSCVKDNRTGLIWEVKSTGGLQSVSHTYTWFLNSVGEENGGNCQDATTCDTEKYIAAVNQLNLCGSNQWRLPERKELSSWLDFSAFNNVNAYNLIFPNMPTSTSLQYWTASRSPNAETEAYMININELTITPTPMTQSLLVRLVH